MLAGAGYAYSWAGANNPINACMLCCMDGRIFHTPAPSLVTHHFRRTAGGSRNKKLSSNP